VADARAPHGIQDDIESVFWVLLWTVLVYSPSSRSSQELTDFLRSTFDSKPGTTTKQHTFTSSDIDSIHLSDDRKVLLDLLKALAQLFRFFYHQPLSSEGPALQDLLQLIDKEKRKGEEANQQTIMTLENAVNQFGLYQRGESHKKLKDHAFVINLFSEYLQMAWPANDAAIEQELIGMDYYGTDAGKMVMKSSKHMLEPVKEEKKGYKKRRVQSHGAPSHVSDDTDLESVGYDDHEHDTNESDSDRSGSAGSALTSLPSFAA
jgi:hypothetical protein